MTIKPFIGDDLVSIILYGSATGPNFQPGKSDINFMIVLTEDGIEHLDQAFEVVSKWRKMRRGRSTLFNGRIHTYLPGCVSD